VGTFIENLKIKVLLTAYLRCLYSAPHHQCQRIDVGKGGLCVLLSKDMYYPFVWQPLTPASRGTLKSPLVR
jgi:hypothetical protein